MDFHQFPKQKSISVEPQNMFLFRTALKAHQGSCEWEAGVEVSGQARSP